MGKSLLAGADKKIQNKFSKKGNVTMEVLIYIIVSIIVFCLVFAGTHKFGEALLVGIFWPLGILYLILSLFYGIGKFL